LTDSTQVIEVGKCGEWIYWTGLVPMEIFQGSLKLYAVIVSEYFAYSDDGMYAGVAVTFT
jgi:hypothetical protein